MEQEEPSAQGIDQLRKFLGHRSNHVTGRAARLAGEWKAESLVPELLAAFERFMENPVKSDPTCAAKKPIVEALIALEYRERDIYLRGAHHVQMEPVYGGSEDTAATLRGVSGEGLLGCRYTDVYSEMATLLMDADPRTRRLAMDCLGRTDTPQAELLLRMAVLADRLETEAFLRKRIPPDEEDADIIALGLQGLMSIAPDRSLPFVASFLQSTKPTVAEGAALAIGEARLPESFPTLLKAWNSRGWFGTQHALLLPMALTRDDAAFAFMLEVIRDERAPLAEAAVKALSIYMGQTERVAEIQAAVDSRQSRELAQLFRQVFE